MLLSDIITKNSNKKKSWNANDHPCKQILQINCKKKKSKRLEVFNSEWSESEKGKKKGLKQSADDLSQTTDLIPSTSDFIKNCSLFHWQHNSWAWQKQMGRMVEVVNSRSSTLSSKSGGHTFKSWLKNSIFPRSHKPCYTGTCLYESLSDRLKSSLLVTCSQEKIQCSGKKRKYKKPHQNNGGELQHSSSAM